jgi:GDPmannose 4,6-dehydratase
VNEVATSADHGGHRSGRPISPNCLLAKGYEVHGIVRRSSSFTRTASTTSTRTPTRPDVRLRLHYGDLTDASRLYRRMRVQCLPDEIYNLGAQSHVKRLLRRPEYTADVDALGTVRLLEAIRDHVANPDP